MILFRLNLGLPLEDSATCDGLTGEGVETEGSRIPDANADEVGAATVRAALYCTRKIWRDKICLTIGRRL
jgi:hypothetical protein